MINKWGVLVAGSDINNSKSYNTLKKKLWGGGGGKGDNSWLNWFQYGKKI